MSASRLSNRYARAIFDLAKEQDQKQPVAKDLRDLATMWKNSADLRSVFENPSFSLAVRRNVVDEIAKRGSFNSIVKNVLYILSDRGRMRYVEQIADAYDELVEQDLGRVRAEVTTAAPLPDAYFAELERCLEAATGRKVQVLRREDPSLIAGVVTRVGDQVFDGSLRTGLEELREDLLSSSMSGSEAPRP